jgi:hypothetical protein
LEHTGQGWVPRPLCPRNPQKRSRSRGHRRLFLQVDPVLWAWLDLNQRPHPDQAYSRDAFMLEERGTASSAIEWQ